MDEQRHLVGFMHSRTIPGASDVIRELIGSLDLCDRSWTVPADEQEMASSTLRETGYLTRRDGTSSA